MYHKELFLRRVDLPFRGGCACRPPALFVHFRSFVVFPIGSIVPALLSPSCADVLARKVFQPFFSPSCTAARADGGVALSVACCFLSRPPFHPTYPCPPRALSFVNHLPALWLIPQPSSVRFPRPQCTTRTTAVRFRPVRLRAVNPLSELLACVRPRTAVRVGGNPYN